MAFLRHVHPCAIFLLGAWDNCAVASSEALAEVGYDASVKIAPHSQFIRREVHSHTHVKDGRAKRSAKDRQDPRNLLGGLLIEKRASKVREALQHYWDGYMAQAPGEDEVKPIAGGPGNTWGGISMLVLDSLDTLYLAGLKKEFAEGTRMVEALNFSAPHETERNSFFELTIRGLGGLLSAYALSGKKIFLVRAQELGERLMHVFPRKMKKHFPGEFLTNAWPDGLIDVHNPEDVEVTQSWHPTTSNIADVASNILEFSYLSQATGKPKFQDAARTVMEHLIDLSAERHQFLTPMFVNPYSLEFATDAVSVGPYADSYFEYLLKAYLQSGKKDRRALQAWKHAMSEMRSTLLRKSDAGLTYVATEAKLHGARRTFEVTNPTMDHLSCFMGGLLALGSHFVPKKDAEAWWLPTGVEITRTCYEMYRSSPSGLTPEVVSFASGGRIVAVDKTYRLRPETLESLFYLYRITGNTTYRTWSWNIFKAINKHTRVRWGFAAAQDVTRVPVKLKDFEETFMGAETLKYALLINMPASTLPLDKYVLNTEAHPLPLLKATQHARGVDVY